jgi:hypothetical protein
VADLRMVARLADLREFEELKQHFDADREEAVQRPARKTFASPEHHDEKKWIELKAYYAGVDAVLGLPEKQRDTQRKESP